MSTHVQQQAERARDETIATVVANKRIREPTRRGIRKIDEACRRIFEGKDELTVSNVVRVLKKLYPGDHPAEQSIRNRSVAGDAYREVIAAWRSYQEVVGKMKKIALPATVRDDLPDTLLNQIQPESARIIILSMRTALRNLRRQFQALQMITPSKLIRHEAAAPDARSHIEHERISLTPAERDAVRAFVDYSEMGTRGCDWDDLGRLVSDRGEPLSRPRLREALEKLRDLAI